MDSKQISSLDLDDWLLECLTKWDISFLTDVQCRALEAGVAAGRSMIVGAPTSSGKTLVGEIAVLNSLRKHERAIYLVSHKALAEQKFLDFRLRFGEEARDPVATVGLNTGDRAEGDINAQLMVATYEKALGLILTGQLDPTNSLIVADELQIIGELNRGPEIEALCAVFKQRGFKQFVALTASVENLADFAAWINCELVFSENRDVPLYQEIWHAKQIYRMMFGQEIGEEIELDFQPSNSVLGVVEQILKRGHGPVLVFTETRREATNYAAEFCEKRPRVGAGIVLAQQIELFSEPTESSNRLQGNAERRVTFHTADLTPQERRVIEGGFSESQFDACFATSTLAAGVNYPFRSVVFSKLTYQYGDRAGTSISRSDYRNMSGRAGRLGTHSDGYAVLLPTNRVELSHANALVLPDNDRVVSQMVNLSLRKSILMLVSSKLASNLGEVIIFFRNTLYWLQTLEKNPDKLSEIEDRSKSAIEWLINNELVYNINSTLLVTPLGQGTALSGLLPGTAVQLAALIKGLIPQLSNSFDEQIPGIIYSICTTDEFRGKKPSRFLPFVQRSYDSILFWADKQLPVELDKTDYQLARCAHAIVLYIKGIAERKISHITGVGSGDIHRLSSDMSWVLDGLHKIACVPEIDCPQTIGNQISQLALRVRWGVPAEALNIIRVAEQNAVPGLGRQRAVALITQGIETLQDILETKREKLIKLLRNEERADALLEAASKTAGVGSNRLRTAHLHFANTLDIEELVERAYESLGTTYEDAILKLLRVENNWIITKLDDGKIQNVPDILIEFDQLEILLECKTCSKSPMLINKEDAWAIVQKAADFDDRMARITLGKPTFDESSKKKAAASKGITLIEHNVFIEGLLRVHAGSIDAKEFLDWLVTPGVSDMERLGGRPTFLTWNGD